MGKKMLVMYGVALVLLAVLLVFATQFKSPTEIMTPPGLYGKNAEIQKAFEASLPGTKGSDITLKYPSEGEYRSSFVMYDLDNDDEDEVLVFYNLKTDEATVHVNLLDYKNDTWQSVYDEVGYGNEIVSVDFDDFNKDGIPEAVFCWSLYDATSSKTITVHSVDFTKKQITGLNTIVNQSYSYMGITDVDKDGLDEIFITWLDNSDKKGQKSYATLLKMNSSGVMSQLGNIATLDGSVSAYASIKYGTFDDGRLVAYLDAFKGENSMITEVLWWDNDTGSMVAPFLSADTLTNTATFRSSAIPSMDIDKDGKIEIPVNSNSGNEDETQISLTTWMGVTPSGFVPKMYSFVNSTVGYSFKIPDNLKSELTAFIQTDKGVTTVYLKGSDGERGEPLFTILVKNTNEINDEDKYTFKVVNDDFEVYGNITSAGETAGFTNELIENSFVFIR